ncbi:CAP domain-containing protein [Streptomyces sp. NPDC054855]
MTLLHAVCLLFVALLPGTPTAAAAQPDPASAVAAEINRLRSDEGCPPIRLRNSLNRAAQEHSADMADRERLTHTGADGSSPADRMRAAGFSPARSGEVIVSGPATPGAAVDAWRDSPPHRAVILNCRYTEAGAGVAAGGSSLWWTLDLATAH